ncbi:MAG: response regulator [Huintestinicola sp.]
MYKILIVEDDSALRFIYSKKKVWSDCGFCIEDQASNGKAALELMEKKQYDLILTDIQMSFIDGIELLREIRSKGIQSEVVLVSSYDEFEYARQGLVYGATDYILKPAEDNKLREMLLRVKEKLDSKKVISKEVIAAAEQLGITVSEEGMVYNICRYFSDNSDRLITLEEMSEAFGFSKDYFGKLFKSHMGTSFNSFYSAVKIEKAKTLLKTGNYKNYEISDMLGYSTVDYFSKIFKEITGETPTQYKAKNE